MDCIMCARRLLVGDSLPVWAFREKNRAANLMISTPSRELPQNDDLSPGHVAKDAGEYPDRRCVPVVPT
jgi:hypothetical protein